MSEHALTHGFTCDDAHRLGAIADELEHLPPEIRRHLDQDGRDARFLRLKQKQILDAISQVDWNLPERHRG